MARGERGQARAGSGSGKQGPGQAPLRLVATEAEGEQRGKEGAWQREGQAL